jgi:hypothetical protein
LAVRTAQEAAKVARQLANAHLDNADYQEQLA